MQNGPPAETHSSKTNAQPVKRRSGRWFFVGMALAMIATSIAGFLPAIIQSATRRAPLNLLAGVHGIVYFLWLFLFLAQSLLIANQRVAWHRKLGLASIGLLALMIALGFTTTTAMIRRGFDLSGDLHIDPHPKDESSADAPTASVFNFSALLAFTTLASAAIAFRRRPQVHKRLMLFANIMIMPAPIAHLFGHLLSTWPPAAINAAFLILSNFFLLAPILGDYLIERRIRFITATLTVGSFAYQQFVILVIAPSAAWHHFAERIS